MKKTFKWLLIVFALACVVATSTTVVLAEDNPDEALPSLSFAAVYPDDTIYEIGANLEVKIVVSSNYKIDNVNFVANGFELISNIDVAGHNIYFTMNHSGSFEPELQCEIQLSNGDCIVADLYGVVVDGVLVVGETSRNETEAAYFRYLELTDEYTTLARNTDLILDDSLISNDSEINVNQTSTVDTWLRGNISFRYNGIIYPLAYFNVELLDVGATFGEEVSIVTVTTNQNGDYVIPFENGQGLFEWGNTDVRIVVKSQGTYVHTCIPASAGEMYERIVYEEDEIASGDNYVKQYVIEVNNYSMIDSTPESNIDYFGSAMYTTQAAIIASRYYAGMKGENIAPVNISYPYPTENEHYKSSNDTIYIRGWTDHDNNSETPRVHPTWDVIMHEYGHHIAFTEGLADSDGGGHSSSVSMADHYYAHLIGSINADTCEFDCKLAQDPDAFDLEECKEEGLKIAWSEGLATYFSNVAQEECALAYSEMDCVGDAGYTRYIGGGTFNHVDDLLQNSEDCEGGVTILLYNMYDSTTSTDDAETLSLGSRVIWNYLIASQAQTLDEFDDYFITHHTSLSDRKMYGAILGQIYITPYFKNAPSSTSVKTPPTIKCGWSSMNHYYNTTNKYKLNFYNSQGTLLAQTDPVNRNVNLDGNTTSITIPNGVWETLLNSGVNVYMSVTRIEEDSPTTEYESGWTQLAMPSIPELNYVDTFSGSLAIGECAWYKFVCPDDGEYVFYSTGTGDTYGEIFSRIVSGTSTEYRIALNDDAGDGNNFSVTMTLSGGDVIYIRVRSYGWSSAVSYGLHISHPTHTHSYTYRYVAHATYTNQHYAYCELWSLDNAGAYYGKQQCNIKVYKMQLH